MSLSELFQDLDPKIAGPLSKITEALRTEISRQIDGVRQDVQSLVGGDAGAEAATAPPPPAEAELDPLEELKLAAAGIDRSDKQASILNALLEGAGRFSSRSAFILIRDDGQRCWDSLGFEDAGRRMQGARVELPNGDSVWSRIQDGAGTRGLSAEECAAFCSQFEASTPTLGALLPLSLGDHVAGYLYADRLGDDPLNITALQLLTFVAGQTLETLPVRKRSSTPALVVAGAAPEPVAAEAPVEEPPVEESPVEEPPVEEPPVEEPPVEEPPAVEVEAPPEPEPAEAAAPPGVSETIPIEVEPEAVEPEAVTAEGDFYEVEPPAVETPPVEAAEPERSEEAPPTEAETFDYQPPPTRDVPDVAVEEPPPVESAPAEPVAPPTPPASDAERSSTQVMPPEDVLGPGWAFTARETVEDTGNEALHEEARRLARLLVTEIKLYNEEQVDQGRRSGDIYRRLQEDIDRSRQIYEDRIEQGIRAENDYFRDALIRILAGGDESLLGA